MDSPTFYPSGIGCDNLNLQASSKPRHLPRHGLKTQSVPLMKPKEKTRPICPLSSKWQIGLFLWLKPYRGGAGTAGGAKRPTWEIPKGTALGAPLVTFPATGKSPGCRAERLHLGGCGGAAPTLGSAEGRPSQKTNPGTSRWGNGRSRSAKSPPASAASWERFPPESAPRQTPPDNS